MGPWLGVPGAAEATPHFHFNSVLHAPSPHFVQNPLTPSRSPKRPSAHTSLPTSSAHSNNLRSTSSGAAAQPRVSQGIYCESVHILPMPFEGSCWLNRDNLPSSMTFYRMQKWIPRLRGPDGRIDTFYEQKVHF